MNRSKKLFLTLTGSLLFLSPLTAKSALNKSVDDFSNINISEEIKEISKLDRSPKILVAANKKIKKRLEELELKNEELENMMRSYIETQSGLTLMELEQIKDERKFHQKKRFRITV
mgnify:CR=1 FL=1|tara:strand:+ start:450 stop:797 length:348 start_codon:yes stop_codon:yes gene_type:complete